MTLVTIANTTTNGDPAANQRIVVNLIHGGAGGTVDGTAITDRYTVTLDADGEGSIELVPNEDISPAGTHYSFSVRGATPSIVRLIRVPASGPVSWTDEAILVEDPSPPTVVPAPASGTAFQVMQVNAAGTGYELTDQTGGGGTATPTAPSPFLGADWALSATVQPAPRDITGGRRHARWGTGEFDISSTHLTPADGPRLLHWQTEDEDAPDFLGASTTPVDWTSSNTWFISAAWKSIDPWHTSTYPQSLGVVQGGNGETSEEDDQIIELALGISENGQIRVTGRGLGNNDFGGLGQFNPAGGVEVGAVVNQSAGTITAVTRVGTSWVQVGDPVTKVDPIVLVNDSHDESIHKFATGYGKCFQSYAALATSMAATPVRRFDAADAIAAVTAPGDTWTGTVDGRTWLLGAGLDTGRIRIPAIYETARSCWALGAGSAALTADTPDLGTESWTMAVVWTPRSGDRDDVLIPQAGPGPSLFRSGDVWSLVLAEPLDDGLLLVEDSGVFGATTDGAGTLDPLAVLTIDAGGGFTVQAVNPGAAIARDVSVITDTAGDVIVSAFVALDFSEAVWASFDRETGTVLLVDDVGATQIGYGVYVPRDGQRLGIRVIGDKAVATADGIVVARGTTSTPTTGFSAVTIDPTGAVVSDFRVREADTITHPTAVLGELANDVPHTLVSIVDQNATPSPTWRVRIDGRDLDVADAPPVDITTTADLRIAPTVHQDLHDIGLWAEVIPDIEIAAIEALNP